MIPAGPAGGWGRDPRPVWKLEKRPPGRGISGSPPAPRVGVGRWRSGWGSLPVPVPPAQWDCVNPKYKQKRRSYRNSGVVLLADPKVSPAPPPAGPAHTQSGRGFRPSSAEKSRAGGGEPLPEAPPWQMDPQGLPSRRSGGPRAWRWEGRRGGGDRREQLRDGRSGHLSA